MFIIILFGIKQLKKLWKKTFLKLFTNCHVSWDTLYINDKGSRMLDVLILEMPGLIEPYPLFLDSTIGIRDNHFGSDFSF